MFFFYIKKIFSLHFTSPNILLLQLFKGHAFLDKGLNCNYITVRPVKLLDLGKRFFGHTSLFNELLLSFNKTTFQLESKLKPYVHF